MTSPDPQPRPIDAKIERSSLGTPEARRMRARVPTADARAVVARAAGYPRTVRSTKTSRNVGG